MADMDAIKRQVGVWLRERREELGMSKAELSRRAHVAYVTVHDAESGRTELRMHRAIEDALQWPAGTLRRAYEGHRPYIQDSDQPQLRVVRAPASGEGAPEGDEESLKSAENADGTINGLALIIRGRIAELARQRGERRMTLAELARKTGIPIATVHQYANGAIRGAGLTPSVMDKLHKLATALELPTEVLAQAARESKHDQEMELMQIWRKLRTPDDRDRALSIMRALAGYKAHG